jgi:hypothetical protein
VQRHSSSHCGRRSAPGAAAIRQLLTEASTSLHQRRHGAGGGGGSRRAKAVALSLAQRARHTIHINGTVFAFGLV